MTVHNSNFVYTEATRHELLFAITDENQSPPVPMDLTDYEVDWAAAPLLPDGTVSTTVEVTRHSNTNLTIDLANSQVSFIIDPVDGLTPGNYFHQLRAVNPNEPDEPVILASGSMAILPQIAMT
jgi:hypothetical protein